MTTLLTTGLLAFLLWPHPTGEIKLSRVGVIDTQRMTEVSTALFKKALEPEMAIVLSFESRLVEFRNQKLKELETLSQQVEAGTLSEQEYLTLQKKLENELQRKISSVHEEMKKEQAALKARQQKDQEARETCYQAAIKQVATERNLVVVLRQETMLYGAKDITREVLDLMHDQDFCQGM